MHAALADLIDLLRLERIEADLFRGRNERKGPARVFGGQVLAQALQAAALTAPDRPPRRAADRESPAPAAEAPAAGHCGR